MKSRFYQIIMKAALMMVFGMISYSTFSQVRVWQFEKRRPIKTQGVYCVFEPFKNEFEGNKQRELFGVSIVPAIGLGLSFLNTSLTNLSTRDEKEFSAELESVNEVTLLKNGTEQFKLRTYYVSRGENQSNPLLTIDFESKRSDSILELRMLESSILGFSPVKLERKHKMINSAYVITVSALIKEYTDTSGNSVLKVLELGKMNFNQIRIGDECIYGCNPANSSSQILMPTRTDKGMKIEVLEISLHFSAKFINPVGTTQSDLNRFLVNHADNNAALIELISTSSLEEESR